MAITLESIKSKLKKHQQEASSSGGFPKTVFLPDGVHKGRFIIDPKEELICQFWSYGYFKNGIRDPLSLPKSELPEGFVNELKQLYDDEFSVLNKWSYGRKHNSLVYFWLTETDSQSENWKPNNLYVLVAKDVFADSYINFLSGLSTDAPEDIIKLLDPKKPTLMVKMEYKSPSQGSKGTCAISINYPNKVLEPINFEGQVYVDLESAYIKPGFDQAKYNALVEKYRTDLKKLKGEIVEEKKEESGNKVEETKKEDIRKENTDSTTSSKEEVKPEDDIPFEPNVETAKQETSESTKPNPSVWDQFKK